VDKVKPATVNIALGYLKAYYQLAIRDKHCKNNPVRQIKDFEPTMHGSVFAGSSGSGARKGGWRTILTARNEA